MNNQIPNIPDSLFTWISERNFNELTTAEQAEVILYFSEEEYSAMHQATRWVEDLAARQQKQQLQKKELFERFDQLHSPAKGVFLFQSNRLWKVAAVFFFILSSMMAYRMNHPIRQGQETLALTHDTIYLEKKYPDTSKSLTAPVIVKKTEEVHSLTSEKTEGKRPLRKNHTLKRQEEARTKEPIAVMNDTRSGAEVLPPLQNAPTLSIPKGSKRNSRKFDSLDRQFRYVSM